MYTFACSRRLLDDEVRGLEKGLRCKVRYVGKIANVYEWWYQIKREELNKNLTHVSLREKELTDKNKKVLSQFELKVLGNFGKV